MPSAIIADDEIHLQQLLQTRLQQVWPELQIIGSACNGPDALRLIDELAPDIAFLDIRMPGNSGMEVARLLAAGGKAPQIVFVTAYDQYAIDAFEHAAVDYVLKPPSLERLQKCVARLKTALARTAPASPDLATLLAQLSQHMGAQAVAQPGTPAQQQLAPAAGQAFPHAVPPLLQWIHAAHGGETRLIAIDEVIYFQSNDKYTSVFTRDGESLLRTPLREIQEQLDPNRFWQIHRSTIVAVKSIAGTKRDLRARLLVKLRGRTEELVVSRNYVDLFKQM
ncbi:MAG: hypothetical protein RL748_3852 [Pseudomonadota bacterium]|jgi:DNA-binding LytR/AlgR family response regulator